MPKIVWRWSKYKNNFLKKLGKGFPEIKKEGRHLIWIHAVSLGETKAVAPLIKKLKALDPSLLILLSTTTETGYAEGLKNVPADHHIFLPLDISYIIKPILKKVVPDTVIVTETDFWYHFQTTAKALGASVVLINGKLSERSLRRFLKIPQLTAKLFGSIDHFYLQGEMYHARFLQLKIPPSKLTITGNIKLDSEVEIGHPDVLKKQLGLTTESVCTLGSTHPPEEKIWIEALKKLWERYAHLKVLIVPRHPERFEEVARLLSHNHIPFSRWSHSGTFLDSNVLLVDAMGVLKKCYEISDLAFVGGSFTEKVGGHNILEPAFYGKPVLFGPYMHSQPDLHALVSTYRAGLQITSDALISTMITLLDDPSILKELGNNGLHLTRMSRGALNLTLNALLPLLQKTKP